MKEILLFTGDWGGLIYAAIWRPLIKKSERLDLWSLAKWLDHQPCGLQGTEEDEWHLSWDTIPKQIALTPNLKLVAPGIWLNEQIFNKSEALERIKPLLLRPELN